MKKETFILGESASAEYYYSYTVMLRALCTKASIASGQKISVAFLPLLYVPSEPDHHVLIDDINDVFVKATRENGFEPYFVMSNLVISCHEGRAGNVVINGVEMFSPTYFWGSKTSSHIEARFFLGIRENLKKYMEGGFLVGNEKPEFEVQRKFILDSDERRGNKVDEKIAVFTKSSVISQSSKNSVISQSSSSVNVSTTSSWKRKAGPWEDVDRSRAKAAKIRAKESRDRKLQDAMKILEGHQQDLASIKRTLSLAKSNDTKRSVTSELSSCDLNKS